MNPTVTKILNHLLYHSDIESNKLIELSEIQLIRAYQFHITLMHEDNDILHAFNDSYILNMIGMKTHNNLLKSIVKKQTEDYLNKKYGD